MYPVLGSILTEAAQLACTCLSDPWVETERKIATEMMQWQSKLVEAEKTISNVPDATVQGLSEQLNLALQLILAAVQSKNPVGLSNALANEFTDTIKTLDSLIPTV